MILVDGITQHEAPGLRYKRWSHLVSTTGRGRAARLRGPDRPTSRLGTAAPESQRCALRRDADEARARDPPRCT